MERINLDIRKFSRKYELNMNSVRSFIKQNFGLTTRDYHALLTPDQYRNMKLYFTEDNEMVALIFYNPGRKKSQIFKNVIKLAKLSSMCYRYEWFRYVIMNGNMTRIKVGEISYDELVRERVWRSSIDRTVVILNEEQQFEALSRLPEGRPETA